MAVCRKVARIRVMAMREAHPVSPEPRLTFRAEAYENDESIDVPLWTCDHQHTSPLDAYQCGRQYLSEQGFTETSVDRAQ